MPVMTNSFRVFLWCGTCLLLLVCTCEYLLRIWGFGLDCCLSVRLNLSVHYQKAFGLMGLFFGYLVWWFCLACGWIVTSLFHIQHTYVYIHLYNHLNRSISGLYLIDSLYWHCGSSRRRHQRRSCFCRRRFRSRFWFVLFDCKRRFVVWLSSSKTSTPRPADRAHPAVVTGLTRTFDRVKETRKRDANIWCHVI